MNTYGTIFDDSMIRNIVQTNLQESTDLLSIQQLLYFIFLGLIPSYFIYKTPLKYRGYKKELWSKAKIILIALLIMASSFSLYSKYYTSFVREHKPLRFSANPSYWLYSVGKYIHNTLSNKEVVMHPLGVDAKIETENIKAKLMIMVVGEAARADHFSLNGYKRETNPLLKKESLINFTQMYSCGTSTAVSVPCMFSYLTKQNYSYKKGHLQENILDVLHHTNAVSILWRDNNSDSKGVALRVPYENYRTSTHNTICNDERECRDTGMLVNLDTYISKQKNKNILIILHQMGNHGPAYFKRYPKEFEKFTPVCQTNQLEECSKEEISNAYDNALLYTDTFLSQTIQLLKSKQKNHQVALFYMSDHGESLGEKGIYLHGLPYFMAPDAQTHIGSFMWLGKELKQKMNLPSTIHKRYSQDNLFHTLLGFFDVQTSIYNKKLDILNDTN